jgi:hypothetical protein
MKNLISKYALLLEILLGMGAIVFQRLHTVMYDTKSSFISQIFTWQGLYLILSICCTCLIILVAKYVTKPLHTGAAAAAECLLMLGCHDLKLCSPENSTIRGRIWIVKSNYLVPIAQWPHRAADDDTDVKIGLEDAKKLIIGEAYHLPRVVVRDITDQDILSYPESIKEFIPLNLRTVLACPIGRQKNLNRLGVVAFDCDASTSTEWNKDQPREIAANVAKVMYAMLAGK